MYFNNLVASNYKLMWSAEFTPICKVRDDGLIKKLECTRAFIAPALKLWWYWGLFSRAMYTSVGSTFPSLSSAPLSFPSIRIWEMSRFSTLESQYLWSSSNENYENLCCGSGDRKATWTTGWWSFEVPPVFHSENPLWFTFISSGTLADLTAESIRSVIPSYRSCSKEYQLQWSHLFHYLTMF